MSEPPRWETPPNAEPNRSANEDSRALPSATPAVGVPSADTPSRARRAGNPSLTWKRWRGVLPPAIVLIVFFNAFWLAGCLATSTLLAYWPIWPTLAIGVVIGVVAALEFLSKKTLAATQRQLERLESDLDLR